MAVNLKKITDFAIMKIGLMADGKVTVSEPKVFTLCEGGNEHTIFRESQEHGKNIINSIRGEAR